ncbi:MAG: type II toxin-antitoxin system RelE/ParE family toxin [bacterium]|nr:type II toxin-antitoxin system RelE/ParE family toxin [bacterium]
MLRKIKWLAENFDAISPEELAGPWKGVFKLRVGDYRILYTGDRLKQDIVIHFIRHRREVYKIK